MIHHKSLSHTKHFQDTMLCSIIINEEQLGVLVGHEHFMLKILHFVVSSPTTLKFLLQSMIYVPLVVLYLAVLTVIGCVPRILWGSGRISGVDGIE